MLYPFSEIANFKTQKERAVKKTLMLVVYPLPDKGYRYPMRRGSGLFILCWAFGDASEKIDKNIVPRLLFLYPDERGNTFIELTSKKVRMKLKRVIAIMCFMVCFLTSVAQDVIVKKDGGRLEGKVVEISDTDVKYRKANNPDGPVYSIKVADLVKIEFENGESEIFVKENLTSQQAPAAVFPGMTGDVKDTELYSQYKDFQDRYKTPKKLRRIGLWVGLPMTVAGGLLTALAYDSEIYCPIGVTLCAAGVVWGTTFYVIAYKKQKKIDSMYELASSPLYRHDILTTNDGKSLSLGVDFIADRVKTKTMGLGMTYTF